MLMSGGSPASRLRVMRSRMMSRDADMTLKVLGSLFVAPKTCCNMEWMRELPLGAESSRAWAS